MNRFYMRLVAATAVFAVLASTVSFADGKSDNLSDFLKKVTTESDYKGSSKWAGELFGNKATSQTVVPAKAAPQENKTP